MVNLSYLLNMTPLEINNTILNNSETIIPQMVDNTNKLSSGYFGLFVMIAIFIVLFVKIFSDKGDIRMDFLRSIMITSGFVFIIGLIASVSGIFNSYLHVIWFFVIFAVSTIWLYLIKKSGF